MNAKERLKRIIRAQNSLLKAKTHLQLAQNAIRKEYDLCVKEASAADGFVADCDDRIERAGSWDGAQPDAYFGRSIWWRRCDRRDFGQLVRVSTQPVADPADMERAVLIGLEYGPDGDISGYQCEGSKGQTVHWLAAWTEMKPGEELQDPPSGRKFTRIHIEGVDFWSVPQKWVPDQGKVGSCSGQGSANAHELNGRLWDVIAEKWKIRPLDVVVLKPPAVWAKWPGWSALHDQILTNQRMVIDPEALAMVSPDGEIAIRILGFWVNVECLHVVTGARAKAAQLLAKDYLWNVEAKRAWVMCDSPEPMAFGEALLATKPPEPWSEVNASDHFAGADKMVAEEPPKKWRILEPGEVVQEGDRVTAKANPPSDPPNGFGWRPVDASVGTSVCQDDACIFARLVSDDPAKEPGHLAGPKPDPGEGYRLVNDSDIGKIVEVQNSTADPWRECTLLAIDWDRPYGFLCRHSDPVIAHRWRFARIKIEEPAKEPEPEHPAGPKPDPGEGYRILSKDPPEDLQDDDEFFHSTVGRWYESIHAAWGYKRQDLYCWYRRKIDVAKEPEPQSLATVAGQDGRESREILLDDWIYIHEAYRDVTPADVGKLVYVRNGELEPWIELRLAAVIGVVFPYRCTKDGIHPMRWQAFRYARIWNEKPASSPVGEGYRRATRADLGKQCEFSDGSTNPDGSLVWGIFARLMAFTTNASTLSAKWHTEEGSYYDCRVKVEG